MELREQMQVSWCRSDVLCSSVDALRHSNTFTDLAMVCFDHHVSSEWHRSHQVVWSEHSSFLRQLCLLHGGDGVDQGRHDVVLVLADTPSWVIAKWIELLYTGETLLGHHEDQHLFLDTGRRLGLSLDLEATPLIDASTDASSIDDELLTEASNEHMGPGETRSSRDEMEDVGLSCNLEPMLIYDTEHNVKENGLETTASTSTQSDGNGVRVEQDLEHGPSVVKSISELMSEEREGHSCRYCFKKCGQEQSSLLGHYCRVHFLCHLRVEFGHLPACCYCGKTFSDTDELLVHLGVDHGRVNRYIRLCARSEHDLSCSECELRSEERVVFDSMDNLIEHMVLTHFRSRLSKRFGFRGSCHFCNRPDSNENDVMLHMAKKHNALHLVAPKHIVEQLEALQESHVDDDEDNDDADDNDNDYNNDNNIAQDQSNLVCQEKSLKTKTLKKRPMEMRVSSKSDGSGCVARPSSSSASLIDFKSDYKQCRDCPRCHQVFASSNSLTRHICMQHIKKEVMQHCSLNRKQCRLCHNTFTDVRALVSHVGKVHGLLENFLQEESNKRKRMKKKKKTPIQSLQSHQSELSGSCSGPRRRSDLEDEHRLVIDLSSSTSALHNEESNHTATSTTIMTITNDDVSKTTLGTSRSSSMSRGPLPTYAPLISLSCPLCPKSDLISRLQVKRHLLATHFNQAFKRLYGRYDKVCCYCSTLSSCLNENLRHIAFTHKKFLRVIPTHMIVEMVKNGLVSMEEAANFLSKETFDNLLPYVTIRNNGSGGNNTTRRDKTLNSNKHTKSSSSLLPSSSSSMSSMSLPLGRFLVSCPLCGRRTLRGKLLIHLTYHFRAELRTRYGSMEPWCTLCKCDFVNQDGFISHMGCVHGQVMSLLSEEQRRQLQQVGFDPDGQIRDTRRRMRKRKATTENQDDDDDNNDNDDNDDDDDQQHFM